MNNGILLIHKPSGVTSFDVVAQVRRLYGTRQVGHTGTLDPLATGLLVVLVGRAVKASEFLTEKDKEYVAGLKLGITTDSEDITGTVITQSNAIPTRDHVISTASRFVGDILQVPPMYSALKVGGEKLVDLARRGITIEREARPITIYSLEIDGNDTDYQMKVHCSKGTYIRTLCADIGNALGCGGVMSSLLRTRAGQFSLADAHTTDEIKAMSEQDREALLMPTELLFFDLSNIVLPDFFAKLARNGCEIYQKKIGTALENGTRVRVSDKNGFFAIGEARDYADGSAIKLIKQLS